MLRHTLAIDDTKTSRRSHRISPPKWSDMRSGEV